AGERRGKQGSAGGPAFGCVYLCGGVGPTAGDLPFLYRDHCRRAAAVANGVGLSGDSDSPTDVLRISRDLALAVCHADHHVGGVAQDVVDHGIVERFDDMDPAVALEILFKLLPVVAGMLAEQVKQLRLYAFLFAEGDTYILG